MTVTSCILYVQDGNRCVYTFFPNGNWIKLQLGECHQVLSNSISWSVSALPSICNIAVIVGLIKLFVSSSVGMGIAFGLASYLWLGFIFNDTVIEITLTLAVSYLAYFTVCYLWNSILLCMIKKCQQFLRTLLLQSWIPKCERDECYSHPIIWLQIFLDRYLQQFSHSSLVANIWIHILEP